MKHQKSFYIIIAFLLFLAQCKKPPQFPIEPQIKFIDFTTFDTSLSTPEYLIYKKGVLHFSFTDGDADLGIDIDTLTDSTYHNLFINYYEIQNGDTVKIEFENGMTYNSIIPNLTPENPTGNGIEGEISDTLIIFTGSPFDTIMYEAWIVDRAGHTSNTITTPLIVRKIRK